MENKIQTNFRLSPEILDMLEKIREYHQGQNEKAFIKPQPLTKTLIVEGIIEMYYRKMVRNGQIKDRVTPLS
jgi:hypothetical protein